MAKFVVVLEKAEDLEGWFVVEIPSLPGCISQGSSREEALVMIRDAAEGWLECAADKAKEQAAAENAEAVEIEI